MQVRQAKQTEISISKAREVYRPVATRGSLVYFLIDNLNALDRVYHYSMANFVYILIKGMDMTPGTLLVMAVYLTYIHLCELVNEQVCTGSKDESKVAESKRLGEEVEVKKRVELLIEFTSFTVFSYVAQVEKTSSWLFLNANEERQRLTIWGRRDCLKGIS